MIGHSRQAEETERRLKEKELKSLLARDDELDGLFERIYEDNVSGKLSDDRFAKMSRRYEEEQKELSEKIKKLRSEIEKQSSRATSTDMFVSRRLTKYAGLYEDDFLKEVIGHSRQAEETERRLKEKELKSLLARDDELDGLFERIYEDNVSGKLSDDRFAKMSRRYEEEQKELSEKIKKLRSEIEKQSSRATSTDMFVSIVRKYTRARKLTPRMLNELVEKIEVYNAEKIDGEWVQRLRIHYNCVGEMNIPNEPALPILAVTVNTRKGVFVSYTTNDRPAV